MTITDLIKHDNYGSEISFHISYKSANIVYVDGNVFGTASISTINAFKKYLTNKK